jgi:hypothetical protein
MRWKHPRTFGAVFLIACVLPLITSCSGGNQGISERRHIANNFSELIVTALDNPLLQDFDRDVLERARVSGRIEQADYDEAYSRFEECTASAGEPVKLTKLSNGLYRVETTPLAEGESLESAVSIVNKCQMGTTSVLAALYGIQQGNPELLADPYEIAQKCLVAKGLADSSFSHEDLSKIMGSPGPAGVPLEERLPFDPYSDEAQACFVGANIAMVKAP